MESPDQPAPDEAGPTADRSRCPRCGERMFPGNFALPILGTPKFAVRLGPVAVESDIASAMCLACGHVELWVKDLERIHRAAAADDQVRDRMNRARRR